MLRNFVLIKYKSFSILVRMNNNIIGFWNWKKKKLKQRFPIINNRDLRLREGQENEMIEKLGNKLGKTKQELLHIIIAI